MVELSKLKVAVLATDGFEESELVEPMRAFLNAGSTVEILAPSTGDQSGYIQAFRNYEKTIKVPVSYYLGEDLARPEDYAGLILPGGALSADLIRALPAALKFIQDINECEKPIAAIGHAPWELISAGLVSDRRLTSSYTIKDDVKNAGGIWQDAEVLTDRNWVTSGQPKDLPEFIRAALDLFSRPIPLMSDEARIAAARARIA